MKKVIQFIAHNYGFQSGFHLVFYTNQVVPTPPLVQLVDGPKFKVKANLESIIVCDKLYYQLN